jgi:cellulase/cellobiase CelA1
LDTGVKSSVDPDDRAKFVNLLQNQTRTGLWLDSFSSTDNLENALQTGGFTKIIFLFYDLPNRDCAASSSNGQLCCSDFAGGATFCNAATMQQFATSDTGYCLGLNDAAAQAGDVDHTYTDYANRVVSIMADYPSIEFHIIVEPDSWPNVITNSGLGENQNVGKKNCSLNTAALSYCAGIDYALRKLTGQIRNDNGTIGQDTSDLGTIIYNMWKSGKIHTYLDIAHSAWMGWDLLADDAKGVMESLLKGNDRGKNSLIKLSAYQQIGTTDNWNTNTSKNGMRANGSNVTVPKADETVYSKPNFYWNTADWCPYFLSGFTMNVSNYNPLGKMAPWDKFSDATNSLVLQDYCGWSNPDQVNASNGDTFTSNKAAACVQPCNAVVNYNFVNNLLNYAGLMGGIYKGVFDKDHGTVWDGETYPSILIDTARNGGAEDVYIANYEAMADEKVQADGKNEGTFIPEPCASWCNVASTSLGQPSFGSNGEILHPSTVDGTQIPFISFAALKPPGESDGCVTSPLKDAADFESGQPGQLVNGVQDGNPQITSGAFLPDSACTPTLLTNGGAPIGSDPTDTCRRFDTMCGHQFTGGYGAKVNGPNSQPSDASSTNTGSTDVSDLTYTEQTQTYMMNCPPEAGVWDMYQIDMLASNYSKFTDGNYATSNSDSFWSRSPKTL